MEYQVEFSKKALKSFLKIPKVTRDKILDKLKSLSVDPYQPNNNIKKFIGEDDGFRLRVGDFRVVYIIKQQKLLICVINIGHIKEVYK